MRFLERFHKGTNGTTYRKFRQYLVGQDASITRTENKVNNTLFELSGGRYVTELGQGSQHVLTVAAVRVLVDEHGTLEELCALHEGSGDGRFVVFTLLAALVLLFDDADALRHREPHAVDRILF